MWFFRFAIILLEFLFIFYYTAVVFQLLDVWKITNRKITWKAIRCRIKFFKAREEPTAILPTNRSSSMVERNTDKVKIGVRFLSSVLIYQYNV